MSELAFERVTLGPLLMVDARMASGLTVVTGNGAPALATLIAAAAGIERPRHGRVSLDGEDPYASPATRGKIAALLAHERLPAAATVLGSVGSVLAARGDRRAPDAVLEPFGLGGWGHRRTQDLGPAELRSLGLVLALSHPGARLLALYEPFQAAGSVPKDSVRDAIARHVAGGAIVLVAAWSAEETRGLPSTELELRAGFLGAARPRLGLVHGSVALSARCLDPAGLVQALSADRTLGGVHWDEQAAPGVVVALGVDLEALARSLSKAALAAGIALEAVGPSVAPAGQPPPNVAPPGTGPSVAPALPPIPVSPTPDQSVGMPTEFADPARPRTESEKP